MSVIVGRALPDARDGLKPVQRRILFAMHELGLTPDRPFRKCARVVGDVLGKYHPHGDQAVYDALVRLVQDFSSRYPVLEGHGNFGSVDDDPPAAMRYTETRLAAIAHEAMLNEIASRTVDFIPNFDGSQQEPTVLPAQLPFLLLNGCTGIAVGMATSIPPHNLIEVVNGIIALIKNPKTSDEKLLSLIPGPDFPTGGEILLGSGIKETYLKGKGSIPMRGLAHIEETKPSKGKHKRSAIVITELPFQLSKAGWIEKLADLVNDGKIAGIADIRDESDRDGMRIIVELKRDSDPEKILSELYKRTSLQNNFGAILLAIVEGQPKQLNLRELLNTFIEYRENTIIRRTKHKLSKTTERLEIVIGLIRALGQMKEVITMIEEAKDSSEAKAKLNTCLNLTDRQSEAVLSMPLRKLTGLEKDSLNKEQKDLNSIKKDLEILLINREKLLETLIEELKELKKKFGNPRKTKLIEGGDELIAEKNASMRPSAELQRKQAFESLPKDGKLLIDSENQVKIISPKIIGRMHLEKSSDLVKDINIAKLIWPIEKEPKILAISEMGRIGLLKWEFAGQNPGSINKFLPAGIETEEIINLIAIDEDDSKSLILISSDGRLKRLSMKEIVDLTGRASTILKMKEKVKLKAAIICEKNGSIILISNFGRVLKIEITEDSMPLMGKLAQGQLFMRLFPEEHIIGAASEKEDENKTIAIGTEEGKFIYLKTNNLKKSVKGDLGEIPINLIQNNKATDNAIHLFDRDEFISLRTNEGRIARLDRSKVEELKKNNLQVYSLELNNKEKIERFITLISPEN